MQPIRRYGKEEQFRRREGGRERERERYLCGRLEGECGGMARTDRVVAL